MKRIPGQKVSYPRAAGRSDGRKSRTLAPPAAPDGQKSRTLAPPAAPDGQKSGTLAPLAAPDGEKLFISLAAGCRPPGRIDRLRARIPEEVWFEIFGHQAPPPALRYETFGPRAAGSFRLAAALFRLAAAPFRLGLR